ncbi:PfkB family carbohydrate kinase [Galactobacter sp.]|uniref:PfkB family carbohydrate kinase n=1 Tax=Galactobacter sp. TaxID=2676125 RepID=UPI0025BCBEE9|nr:PfkB family carbohydrate kinase [Galactobacter sp.]
MRLLGIGDNVLDHYVDEGKLYPGGNAVNVAVYTAQLGARGNGYIGIVGTDVQGDHLLTSIEAEGVDTSLVRRTVGPTGSPQVALDADGDRRFVGTNRGGVQHALRLRLTEDDLVAVAAADVAHTSVYSSLEDRLAELAALGPVSFDFSDEHGDEYVAQVCPHVSHAFFSGAGMPRAEVEALAAHALRLGCTTAVVTLGAEGAWVASADGGFVQGTHRVDPVDTLGAGDGFISGFLYELYSGASVADAALAGAKAAARACGFNGAFGRAMDFDDIPVEQRPVAIPL